MLSEYISKDPDVCGGRACLKGRRVRVQDIACYSEWWGWSPDRIATELELSLTEVHLALAYYFENLEEIREEISHEIEAHQSGKKKATSKLAAKLGAISPESKSA